MRGVNAGLLGLLREGATLVVASRQRAAALREAHARAELAAGRSAWRAPEILPWNSFVNRELERAVRAGGHDWRLLQPLEEWLLWREAALEASAEHALLRPAELARSAQQAAVLIDAWRLPVATDTEEGRLLQAVLEGFRRSCRALRALSASDPCGWPEGLWARRAAALTQTFIADGEQRGPVWQQRLAQCGVRVLPPPERAPSAQPQLLVCADAGDELLQAARWCRAHLQADPQARLLVVVPQLDRVRATLVRVFDAELHPAGILAGMLADGTAAGAPYAIEGGVPLAGHALARDALALLRLAGDGLEFDEAAAWLRSPYFALGGQAQRCRLELWLREQRVTRLDAPLLAALEPRAGARESWLAAALAPLRELATRMQPMRGRQQTPEQWARTFADWLEQAGWPGGRALGSEEQQLHGRCQELLGELAQLPGATRRWTLAQAQQTLASRWNDVHFEAATPDVPIIVTADCGDPLLDYDGIRVCGLTAERWPMPGRAHPLLGVAAQRAAGIAWATPAGQQRLAGRSLQDWRRAGGELVLSHARMEDQVPQQVSPLLRTLPATASAAARPLLIAALQQQGRCEEYRQASGAPWPAATRLPGGTRALQLQADCPYRAYAELRLDAAPVSEPVPGIDAQLRGLLLHDALEQLWRAIGDRQGDDQAALAALDQAQRLARVQVAVSHAVRTQLQRSAWPPDPGSLRREQLRCERLLMQLLDWELRRAPFTVRELERNAQLLLGEAQVQLRIDRVDFTGAGSIVLDYKSGSGRPFDTGSERLRQPQLPAYALACAQAGDAAISAVATVHLRPDGVSVRGVAASDECLPKLPVASMEWPLQLQRWQQQLGSLAQEFLAGEARVDPQPQACRYCHLASCCRVLAQPSVDADGEGVDDAGAADGI